MTDLTTPPTPAPTSHGAGRELPDFLVPFAGMHAAMRRDASRLQRAVTSVRGPAEGHALNGWWQRFAEVIVHHHHREDDLVWPAIERRSATFAVDRIPLDGDHAALDQVMADVGAALVAMCDERRDPDTARIVAEGAAVALAVLLGEHLDREEALVFPLLAGTWTPDEYFDLERRMRKGTTLRSMAFELPWVLDGADARCRAAIEAILPKAVRLLLRRSWQPRYERLAAPLLRVR